MSKDPKTQLNLGTDPKLYLLCVPRIQLRPSDLRSLCKLSDFTVLHPRNHFCQRYCQRPVTKSVLVAPLFISPHRLHGWHTVKFSAFAVGGDISYTTNKLLGAAYKQSDVNLHLPGLALQWHRSGPQVWKSALQLHLCTGYTCQNLPCVD